MAVRLSALHTGHFLPSGKFLVLISVRGWVDPKAIVQLEGLGQLKNPMTSLGIKPATFKLVAWCLNQLCYHVSRNRLLSQQNLCGLSFYFVNDMPQIYEEFPDHCCSECLVRHLVWWSSFQKNRNSFFSFKYQPQFLLPSKQIIW
jgi:hypothetical protein